MITTYVLAALLAEAAEGQSNREGQTNQVVVQVPEGTMTCTKEGDHLVCVLPLRKEAVEPEPQPAAKLASKAKPYKRSPPMPALPDPQILTQLKVAERNIELARALLPKATTTEEVVLAEQLLYWAQEQYKRTEALMHVQGEELRLAPDPFEGHGVSDAQSM